MAMCETYINVLVKLWIKSDFIYLFIYFNFVRQI